MTEQATKVDYMLLFRGTNWDKDLSPEQIQTAVTNWYQWFDGLIKDGRALSGHPLANEGKVLSGKKGRIVADGPFAESKEAIGGYFYLRVDNEDEAIEIARRCPGLEYGVTVEVRPVADMCAVRARAVEHGHVQREMVAA
jgi:hypothetical protein